MKRILFGKNVTAAAPGSAQGLYLIVSDIEAARAELVGRGVGISEVFHDAGDVHAGADEPYLFGRLRVSGPDPDTMAARPPSGNTVSAWRKSSTSPVAASVPAASCAPRPPGARRMRAPRFKASSKLPSVLPPLTTITRRKSPMPLQPFLRSSVSAPAEERDLHLAAGDLLAAAVVELGRARVGVTSHVPRHYNRTDPHALVTDAIRSTSGFCSAPLLSPGESRLPPASKSLCLQLQITPPLYQQGKVVTDQACHANGIFVGEHRD